MTTEIGGVLCANITNRGYLDSTLTKSRYTLLRRSFNEIAYRSIEQFRQHIDPEETFYADVLHGDLLVAIGGDNAAESISRLALALKQSWKESTLAKELRKLGNHSYVNRRMDLSIGLGLGLLDLSLNPFTSKPIMGWYPKLIREIQGLAESCAPRSLILVTTEVREAAQEANLGMRFGKPVNPIPDASGLSIYPVLSYPKLAA